MTANLLCEKELQTTKNKFKAYEVPQPDSVNQLPLPATDRKLI
jgi:hypothetical protein